MTAGDNDKVFEPRRFRRLLVVFDPAFESMPAVDVIARLAAQMEAELEGLFIEDEDLLRAAGYADAGAVSMLSATRRSLEPSVLRRALRNQAESSRIAIERAGRACSVKVSFRVRRGRIADEVLASGEGVDLVVLDWSCGELVLRSRVRRPRPGAIARTIAEATPRPVLLLRRSAPDHGPILVAYDGSSSADQAVDVAAELARADGGEVEVVFLTETFSKLASWQESVAQRLQGHGVVATFLHGPNADLGILYREARRQQARLMVLEAGLPFLEEEAAGRLLARMDCSVLLVR